MSELRHTERYQNKEKCCRKVPIAKCLKSKAREMYWNKQFRKIEAEVATPHHYRKQYVKKLLPPKVFDAVSNVLHFKHDYTAKPEPAEPPPDKESICTRDIMEQLDEVRFQDDTGKLLKDGQESLASILRSRITIQTTFERKKGKNPYINFLRKSPDVANIWLPKKPPDIRVKPLIEKSQLITDNIITDFVGWLNELGQISSDVVLNEDTLRTMFRIGTNEFAIKAICIQVKEMASVPAAIANANGTPEKSTRNVLRENLAKDIQAEKLQKKTFAFGTSLPADLQTYPPNNQTYDRWIKCLHVPEELRTLEYVFKDITDISSVRAYCQWLIQNPNLPRPQYLNDLGLINDAYWRGSLSIDTRELEAYIETLLEKEFSNSKGIPLGSRRGILHRHSSIL